MNPSILTKEVQDFINSHLKSDLAKLAFKGSPFTDVSIQELINQLVSKSKCQEKLPTWFATPQIYYPPKLNIEQTSSEKTALYKSSIMAGESIIDLTGGLGVDCFYFARVFKKVIHCEISEELSSIASYNFIQLNTTNITCIHDDGISYLKNTTEKFDWIYIDPSRRNEEKGKVFRLGDCFPNVPLHLELLFHHTDSILVKVSPFLDISIGIEELKWVQEVHVVAVQHEVKELLFVLKKDHTKLITIKTINLIENTPQTFQFDLTNEKKPVSYGNPSNYIYEPNKALLKAGAFDILANYYQLNKIAPNTHLYTSDDLREFPGTVYKVIAQVPYQFKKMKAVLPHLTANIKIRNFPDSINTIKNKLKLKDGGEFYVFFMTDIKEKPLVLITKKANF